MSLPTLSTAGFVTEPYEIADRLLSYFFVTNASQSNFYLGNLSSLPFIIQQNTNDALGTSTAVKDTLNKLFSRYFDSAVADADVRAPTVKSDDNRYDLQVAVTFTKDSQTYNIAYLVNVVDSKIGKIFSLNNG